MMPADLDLEQFLFKQEILVWYEIKVNLYKDNKAI